MKWLVQATLRRAGQSFLAGVFALLPVVITVAVIVWVAGFLEGFLGPDSILGSGIRNLGLHFASDATLAYLIGALLVLGAVFVIGVLVEAGARNLFQRLTGALLSRIPIIGSIYGTSQQLVGMLEKKDDANLKGMKVVFCLFGNEGGAGFLALLVSAERFRIRERDYQIVIVPTAPVPFGGGLLFVPVEAIQPAEMSVEGLISIYVSMGISATQFLPTTRTPGGKQAVP
jgi:uncharacterized membrane protein